MGTGRNGTGNLAKEKVLKLVDMGLQVVNGLPWQPVHLSLREKWFVVVSVNVRGGGGGGAAHSARITVMLFTWDPFNLGMKWKVSWEAASFA